MLTLNSTNEDILKEVGRGIHELMYHYKNHRGGEKRYEKMRDRLLAKAMREQTAQFSDVYEYITKDGNRWRIFDHAHYFPESYGANTNTTSFIYYETYGSCGAFIPFYESGENKCRLVVIFTSHFFLRLCQRMEITYRSSAMINAFLEMLPSMIIMKKETFRFGKREVTVGLPGSIGNGVFRYDEDGKRVIEIDSFLKNTELSKKQRKAVEQLHKAQQVVRYEPKMMKIARYNRIREENGSWEGSQMIIDDAMHHLESLGHPKEVTDNYKNVFMWVQMVCSEQLPKNISMSTICKRAMEAGDEVQHLYDSCCRRILFNEDWMSEATDVLIHAASFYQLYTGQCFDMQRGYEYLHKQMEPDKDVEPFPGLLDYMAWYIHKCKEFDNKHKK